MTAQEAKEYMKKQVRHLLNDWRHKRDMRDVRMQVTGMMKAFKTAGIISEDEYMDILEEVLP